MKEKNENEENYNIKINIYNELIDFKINSDYNNFIHNFCKIFNVAPEKINSFILSYNDEDGDSIMLTTEEDYTIFFQQVKEKTVNSLIVEINENKNNDIDPVECFGSALNYQEQIDQANNQIKNDINNNMNNNNNINNINMNNIINKSNDKIINSYADINLDIDYNNQNVNNFIPNNEYDNNNGQIDDIIFEYKCTNCSTYPIICLLYYCPDCNMYLCESCKNITNHQHSFLEIKSKNELTKIKEKENEELAKKNQMNNQNDYNIFNPYYSNVNQNNYNNINNPYNLYNNNNFNNNNFNNNNQYNNNNPNNFNNAHNNYNNQQQQRFFKNPFYHFIPKPFRHLHKKKMDFIHKKDFGILNPFFDYMKYLKAIHEARKTYNLDEISDHQLIEALKKTNGNIDEAIVQLLPK